MYNKHIIELFEQLLKQYKNDKTLDKNIRKYKIMATKNIIQTLRNLDYEITKDNIDNLKNIRGVGDKTIKRLHEILDTGKLSDIDITNVIKSEDYYFKQIPHKEMQFYDDYFYNIAKSIDEYVIYTMCGSYRRKTEYSNDIDILISHPTKHDILDIFVEKIKKKDIIVSILNAGKLKYSMIINIKFININRKVDIRFINPKSYFTALLYFTGSALFNQNMRTHAKTLGYKLSEYNIYDINNDIFIYPMSENDIFKLLKLEYMKPEERISNLKYIMK